MEEYAKLEDQTVQATQAVAEQAEERDDENEDPEQIVEKSQKRKSGNEEQRLANKRLATRSLTWLILLGEINCSIKSSLGRKVLTSGFSPSKS